MKLFRLLFYFFLVLFFLLSITPHVQSAYALHPAKLQKEVLFMEKIAYMGEDVWGAYSDKYRHILAFWLLSVLFDLSYFIEGIKKALFLVLYGVFIEVVQAFVPYREADLFDIIINTTAIALYFLITRYVLKNYFLQWYSLYQRRVVG